MDKNAAKIMLISDFLDQHKDDLDPFEYEFIKKNIMHIEKNFIMDRLRLEFLEQREQRINPKIYSLPSRDKNNL